MKLCKFSGELCDEAVRVDRQGVFYRTGVYCRLERTLVEELDKCPKGKKKKKWKEEGHGDM